MIDISSLGLNLDLKNKVLYQRNVERLGYIRLNQKQYNFISNFLKETMLEGCKLPNNNFTQEELKQYEINLAALTTQKVMHTIDYINMNEKVFLFPLFHLTIARNIGDRIQEKLKFCSLEKEWFIKYIQESKEIDLFLNAAEIFKKMDWDNKDL